MLNECQKYIGYTAVLILIFAVIWAGCDLNDDPIEDEPFFEIQVSGDVSEQLAGPSALFALFADPEVDEDGFALELITQDGRGVALTGRFAAVPAEGTYDIMLLDEDEIAPDESPLIHIEVGELLGVFATVREGAPASYHTVSGFLDVHASTEERVEGTFEFTAQLPVENEEENDADRPEVVVQGQFAADRAQVQ